MLLGKPPSKGNTPTCVGKTFHIFRAECFCQKHPHLRGEDLLPVLPRSLQKETPPPAWGRPNWVFLNVPALGNTPTCVGKTSSIAETRELSEKHPHLRGEDRFLAANPFAMPGNTPTCVGKTQRPSFSIPVLQKHPHLRGEDTMFLNLVFSKKETPPPAWGRQKHLDDLAEVFGNTPTCVGKTVIKRFFLFAPQKHPHLRGEDIAAFGLTQLREETPPPAWGRRSSRVGIKV